MTQDLTKITTPLGLLDSETRKALLECGGPWLIWNARDVWLDCFDVPWQEIAVYRKKPAPREYVAWQVCQANGERYYSPWVNKSNADNEARKIGGFVVKLTGTHDE